MLLILFNNCVGSHGEVMVSGLVNILEACRKEVMET